MKKKPHTMEEIAEYYRNLREEMMNSKEETEEEKEMRKQKEENYNKNVESVLDFELRFLQKNKEDY